MFKNTSCKQRIKMRYSTGPRLAEATGDLTGNKIADNITSIGKLKEKENQKK